MNQFKTYIIYFQFFIFFFVFTSISAATNTNKIIATVNNKPITSLDIEHRINLLLYNTNLKLNSENKDKFYKDAIDSLIDDQLKFQEGTKFGKELIDQASKKANDLVIKNFGGNLEKSNQQLDKIQVPFSKVKRNYTSEIIWISVIKSLYQKEFQNIDTKINNRLSSLKRKLKEHHVNVSEIILSPNKNRTFNETKSLSEKIYSALIEGADFNAIAKQFSSSKSKENGGNIGWVETKTLSEELKKIILPLDVGQISNPIQLNGMFIIYRLEGKIKDGEQSINETIFSLARLFYPISNTENNSTNLSNASKVSKDLEKVSNCEQLNDLHLSYGNIEPIEKAEIAYINLSKELKTEVISLNKNEYTEPLLVSKGLVIIMVCDRFIPKIKMPNRESLKIRIENEIFSQLSNRYLNKLRKSAYIEILD